MTTLTRLDVSFSSPGDECRGLAVHARRRAAAAGDPRSRPRRHPGVRARAVRSPVRGRGHRRARVYLPALRRQRRRSLASCSTSIASSPTGRRRSPTRAPCAEVDPERVALFGSSFGGGHVITTAARDHRVAAVDQPVPVHQRHRLLDDDRAGLDREADRARLRDEFARLRGRAPGPGRARGPARVGRDDDSARRDAGLPRPGPDGVRFRQRGRRANRATTDLHHPGRDAKRVRCPILFCICDDDSVAPAGRTARYAATGAARRGQSTTRSATSTSTRGEPFEQAVRDQTEFLVRHLEVANAAPLTPPRNERLTA